MDYPYPPIPGTTKLSYSTDPPINAKGLLCPELMCPKPPVVGSKSIFAFWHSGIGTLPPYLLRNVVNWYRRFSPLGWTVYVLDNVPDSPLNVSRFIDTSDPSIVPEAYSKATLGGQYTAQHTSDLIRYPLLLRYGGVYLDVGILQFGDLDWLWTEHISNPNSPYDFSGFTMGDAPDLSVVNFALVCGPNNPLIQRAHYILLQIWRGKNITTGMHRHPLVNHVPLLRVPHEVVVEDEVHGKMVINDEAMTDYAIQIQCMGAAQRWLDKENGWDGPKYTREKCWLFNMIRHSYVHEQMTKWSGQRSFELFSLRLPNSGEEETEDQRLARKIVETAVAESWCLKLGHGFSAKLFGGDTLGMLWRKHDGNDSGEGTYAGWIRWAEVNCKQRVPIQPMKIPVYKPTMIGKLIT